jgi:hypothetical protein
MLESLSFDVFFRKKTWPDLSHNFHSNSARVVSHIRGFVITTFVTTVARNAFLISKIMLKYAYITNLHS